MLVESFVEKEMHNMPCCYEYNFFADYTKVYYAQFVCHILCCFGKVLIEKNRMKKQQLVFLDEQKK